MSKTKQFLIEVSERHGYGGHVNEEVLEIAIIEWENLYDRKKDEYLNKEKEEGTRNERVS